VLKAGLVTLADFLLETPMGFPPATLLDEAEESEELLSAQIFSSDKPLAARDSPRRVVARRSCPSASVSRRASARGLGGGDVERSDPALVPSGCCR
jgi:hypothetical protein